MKILLSLTLSLIATIAALAESYVSGSFQPSTNAVNEQLLGHWIQHGGTTSPSSLTNIFFVSWPKTNFLFNVPGLLGGNQVFGVYPINSSGVGPVLAITNNVVIPPTPVISITITITNTTTIEIR